MDQYQSCINTKVGVDGCISVEVWGGGPWKHGIACFNNWRGLGGMEGELKGRRIAVCIQNPMQRMELPATSMFFRLRVSLGLTHA